MTNYKIYKATNKLTNKVYIGQTIKTLEERKSAHIARMTFGSNYYFHNALRKYGTDNFEWEILHENIQTKEEADEIEIEEIIKFKATDKNNGYNLATGGGGGDTFVNNPRKEEIREHLRKINTGKKMSKEAIEKRIKTIKDNGTFAGSNNPMFGKKLTQEHRDKISSSSKHISPKTNGKTLEDVYGVEKANDIKNKISVGNKGRVFTKEHRDKIGEFNRGKKLSNETKEKISKSNKGKLPHNTRLTAEIVKSLRKDIFPSKPESKSWRLFYVELSKIYNISPSVLLKIRYKTLWKNI
jgi:group I intron endonuclease